MMPAELLKAMPDSVLNFARTKAAAGTSWSGASPVEEYTLTYSTGTDGQEVTLEVAQWSQGEDAQSQYDNLTGAMTGKELGSGNVKVSGQATGAYSAKTDPNDETKAIAVCVMIPRVLGHWCQGFGASLLPAVPAVHLVVGYWT